MRRLLSAREIAIWAVFFLLVSIALVVTGFTSDDPDSALYAALSASSRRMASGSRSIASRSARAGASGTLRCCSQSRKVVTGR